MNSNDSIPENHSPAPWSYEYNPYAMNVASDEPDTEIPAFEIFDADGNKIFDTNEHLPQKLQEANARLAVAASELLPALIECANLLADYDESAGEEGRIYRRAIAIIKQATGE